MVIPWQGFPLRDVIARARAAAGARSSSSSPPCSTRSRCPGSGATCCDWPYVEALRIDEAMHPLALLATGLYGRTLPNQNGAPLRLVVPWKYGFKGVKAIVNDASPTTQPRNHLERRARPTSTASTPT